MLWTPDDMNRERQEHVARQTAAALPSSTCPADATAPRQPLRLASAAVASHLTPRVVAVHARMKRSGSATARGRPTQVMACYAVASAKRRLARTRSWKMARLAGVSISLCACPALSVCVRTGLLARPCQPVLPGILTRTNCCTRAQPTLHTPPIPTPYNNTYVVLYSCDDAHTPCDECALVQPGRGLLLVMWLGSRDAEDAAGPVCRLNYYAYACRRPSRITRTLVVTDKKESRVHDAAR